MHFNQNTQDREDIYCQRCATVANAKRFSPKTNAQIRSVTCTTGLLPSSRRFKPTAPAVCPNLGLSAEVPGLRGVPVAAFPLSGSTAAVAALSHFHIGNWQLDRRIGVRSHRQLCTLSYAMSTLPPRVHVIVNAAIRTASRLKPACYAMGMGRPERYESSSGFGSPSWQFEFCFTWTLTDY